MDGGDSDLTEVMQFLSAMKKFVRFNIEDPHTVLVEAFQHRFEDTLKVRNANLRYSRTTVHVHPVQRRCSVEPYLLRVRALRTLEHASARCAARGSAISFRISASTALPLIGAVAWKRTPQVLDVPSPWKCTWKRSAGITIGGCPPTPGHSVPLYRRRPPHES